MRRQATAEEAPAVNLGRRLSAHEQEVVAHERVTDVPDVAREVDEDREQRPELYDRDGRSHLLGVESFGEPRQTRREDQVRRGAYGYELCEPLNDAEYDCL